MMLGLISVLDAKLLNPKRKHTNSVVWPVELRADNTVIILMLHLKLVHPVFEILTREDRECACGSFLLTHTRMRAHNPYLPEN